MSSILSTETLKNQFDRNENALFDEVDVHFPQDENHPRYVLPVTQ